MIPKDEGAFSVASKQNQTRDVLQVEASIEVADEAVLQALRDVRWIDGAVNRDRSGISSALIQYDLNFHYKKLDAYRPKDCDLGGVTIRQLGNARVEVRFIRCLAAPSLGEFAARFRDSSLYDRYPEIVQALPEILLKNAMLVRECVINSLESDGLLSNRSEEQTPLIAPEGDLSGLPLRSPYVDPQRLAELRTIESHDFDLSKLIRLCEELNEASAARNYFSAAMLIRAITDHIPPIFGCRNFTEVANYCGGRSFKDPMLHLERSLHAIAGGFLHAQISRREPLPNETQVNFSSELDVLLTEIIRKLG